MEELNRIGYEIRGGALAVHKAIGPGCFESAYVPCLVHELAKRKLEFRTKVPLTLRYETVVVPGAYEADVIVEGSVLLEIKAVEQIAPVHLRQLQTYLRLSGCPLGFVLNFGTNRFFDGVERRVNNFPAGTTSHSE
jgi:GxxExxY protein